MTVELDPVFPFSHSMGLAGRRIDIYTRQKNRLSQKLLNRPLH